MMRNGDKMNKNNLAYNLKRIRTKNGYTQKNIANYLNMETATYTMYETGTSTPNFTILVEISKILNVSLDYLILNKPQVENDYIDYVENLTNNLVKLNSLLVSITEIINDVNDTDNLNKLKYRVLPEVGEVAAGMPILCNENIETYHIVKNKLFTSDKSYYVLKIKGNSMNKVYKNGELVVVEVTNVAENNDIVIALIDNTEVTIKKYSKANDNIILTPMSFDDSYKELYYNIINTNVIILGKVICRLDDVK